MNLNSFVKLLDLDKNGTLVAQAYSFNDFRGIRITSKEYDSNYSLFIKANGEIHWINMNCSSSKRHIQLAEKMQLEYASSILQQFESYFNKIASEAEVKTVCDF